MQGNIIALRTGMPLSFSELCGPQRSLSSLATVSCHFKSQPSALTAPCNEEEGKERRESCARSCHDFSVVFCRMLSAGVKERGVRICKVFKRVD